MKAIRVHKFSGLPALTAGLINGTLTPAVGREFALSEAAAAQRAVLEPGAYGKIVLVR